MKSMPQDTVREMVLAIADDYLVQGHILTSLAGWGPELEINIALSSMGQDNLGHARLLYGHIVGTDRDAINALIFDRKVDDFKARDLSWIYSAAWETIVAKHFLLSQHANIWNVAMTSAALDGLDETMSRIAVETTFHSDYWETWLAQSVNGSANGRARVISELTRLAPHVSPHVSGINEKEAAELNRAVTTAVSEHLARLGLRIDVQSAGSLDIADDRRRVAEDLAYVYSEAPGHW